MARESLAVEQVDKQLKRLNQIKKRLDLMRQKSSSELYELNLQCDELKNNIFPEKKPENSDSP